LYRESANSIYLDLLFDESSFDKYFKFVDIEQFESIKNVPE